MLEPTELFWSSEDLEPRSHAFFESAGLEQKILGEWRQPSALESLQWLWWIEQVKKQCGNR